MGKLKSDIMTRLNQKLRVLKGSCEVYEEKNNCSPREISRRFVDYVADYALICRKGEFSIGLFINYKQLKPSFYASFAVSEKNKYSSKYEIKKMFVSKRTYDFDDFSEKLRLVCSKNNLADPFFENFVKIMNVEVSKETTDELMLLKRELSEESRSLSESIQEMDQQVEAIHQQLNLSVHEKELEELKKLVKKKEREIKKINAKTANIQKKINVKRKKLVAVNKKLENNALFLKFSS